jgi:hypothetical protein
MAQTELGGGLVGTTVHALRHRAHGRARLGRCARERVERTGVRELSADAVSKRAARSRSSRLGYESRSEFRRILKVTAFEVRIAFFNRLLEPYALFLA